MPSPEQRATEMGEEGEGSLPTREGPSGHSQADTSTNNLLASVKEQELQFERLTRELEEERQIVASQLERCMLGAESPGDDDDDASSSDSSEKSFAWRSTGSVAHMTSYADSGYQDSSMSYYSVSRENVVLSEPRHVLSGSGPRGSPSHGRSSRAEGQASAQVSASGRVMRRMGSLSSRGQSPVCGVGGAVSPSRVSLRTSQGGSTYGSPILTEPKPLASIFPGTTMPPSSLPGPGTTPSFQRATSPYSPTHQRNGNGDSPLRTSPLPGSASHATSPQQAMGSVSGRLGSTLSLVEGRGLSGSPLRSCMTAVPQHYGSTLPRQGALPYIHDAYGLYERTALPLSRPDSLTGLHSSYATHHSPLDQDMRMAMSPDCHVTPVYDDRAFQSPLYHSPTHTHHGSHSAIYRTLTGAENLQRTLQRTTSHCSTLAYQRSSYGLNTAGSYADPYRVSQQGQGPNETSFSRHSGLVDRAATRSPSIDSIQKDPREFAWRDPDLPEVIHMLQHHFPSVQANAAAYLQHLCYGDNRIKVEVCHLGGIQHLVDLLDHKAVEVQKSSCGALRNLVYGKATDDNKVALRNSGGVPALLRLLRKTTDNEVRELVTGVLWNLSSCDAVKMTIIRDALSTLTNTVVIPHSGWSSSNYREETKLKFHSSLLLRNTTGCLRNLSSAGEEARGQLRCCEGLVDSLLYVLKACVSTSDFDSKIVENCVCTLRNLSYRLEIEMPSSRLLGTQELDALLGYGSPSKDLDYLCWGKKRKKKKRGWLDDKWDGVGPIPGFGKPPRGAEMLWHPAVVKPYLSLLAESSNPATLEGSAGSLQNLSAGNWKFAAYIRAAVRKEKGLPILVELLRMDNDRVVCSVATALRNMALDSRNKELIGKYAMRDLVNRLPGGSPSLLSDETVASVCCTLHEVTSRNMENAKALADTGGIEKLVDISKGRGKGYSMKVVKAAAQVLNTLWQYRDLRTLYKQDGWHHGHFITPVSTLERDRYRSQPTLPTSTLQMSPVPRQSGGSATSSPAMLGIRRHSSNYQRAQSSMQLDTYYGNNSLHRNQYTGSEKQTPYFIGSYSSPSREDYPRSQEDVFYSDEPDRNTYNNYRMYLSSPQGYGEEEPGPYQDEPENLTSTERYNTSQSNRLKSNTNTTNYVDFYSTTRRPSQKANQYTGSPDSWV
ncbi:plakophilin-4 isoform X5 [Oncorhynchus tshawytscha]|uniref:plakophilin-4 isoform X5 n=1 Tax=Oncorhynchus tshawytscha TaxID=74940 RepID=UPI000D0A6CC6|nr:plakophilin-4 isoform X5 [Oncorhynchus tshawytscha]